MTPDTHSPNAQAHIAIPPRAARREPIDWVAKLRDAPAAPLPSWPQFVDLTGERFSRLVVVHHLGAFRGHTRWRCECDCGGVAIATSANLRGGHSKSCGCWNIEQIKSRVTTHGEGNPRADGGVSAEYSCWQKIKARCGNTNDPRYHRYGGRGIHVCDRWVNGDGVSGGYECFLADVGRRPSSLHTLDREDNDGNYEPGNVRWATQKVQQRNRGDTVVVEWEGERIALADLADDLGLNRKLVAARLLKGWSVERAVTEPSHWRGRK